MIWVLYKMIKKYGFLKGIVQTGTYFPLWIVVELALVLKWAARSCQLANVLKWKHCTHQLQSFSIVPAVTSSGERFSLFFSTVSKFSGLYKRTSDKFTVLAMYVLNRGFFLHVKMRCFAHNLRRYWSRYCQSYNMVTRHVFQQHIRGTYSNTYLGNVPWPKSTRIIVS